MLVRKAAGHLIRTSVQREDLNKMYRNNMISIIPLQIFVFYTKAFSKITNKKIKKNTQTSQWMNFTVRERAG